MARRGESGGTSKLQRAAAVARYTMRMAAIAAVLVGALYGYHQVEQFLIRDPRFRLPVPEYRLQTPNLTITGLKNASRMNVLRVFSNDFGRSVYLIPLGTRRVELRSVDWVRDASISRIWPNRILARIEERRPVAFLEVPAETSRVSRVALIDRDGVILQPTRNEVFHLPVVTGIRQDMPIASRRERIREMERFIAEIGPLADRVSEVDVSDRDNLKVTARAGGRAVLLLMGDHNFAGRMRNFVDNFAEIERRMPDAKTLDLRLEDRITAVEDAGGKE
jgi:cell division protein FtsQ